MNKWRRAHKAQQKRVGIKVRAIRAATRGSIVAAIAAQACARINLIRSAPGDPVARAAAMMRCVIEGNLSMRRAFGLI